MTDDKPAGGELAARIKAAIDDSGPMPFERFMARALYEPELGYYARREARVGREGDFVTSPAMTPIFGRTLARLVEHVEGGPLRIVDAGAGEGGLLAALLPAARARHPDLELEAVVVERGPALRARAVERLAAAGFDPIALADTAELAKLAPRPGLVIANELFDALPARRLRRSRGRLEEAHVVVSEDHLAERWLTAQTPAPRPIPPRAIECAWPARVEELAGELAAAVESGLVCVIDYGYPERFLYSADGPGNAVRGFRGGALADSLVSAPGEIDLTAHVDFSRLDRAAHSVGLERGLFTEQSYLLMGLGILDDPAGATRALRLIHPEDMGGAFKVLLMAKNQAIASLRALTIRDRSRLL